MAYAVRKKIWAVVFGVFILAGSFVFPAHAENSSKGLGYVVSIDAQSGEQLVYPAVAMEAEGGSYIYANIESAQNISSVGYVSYDGQSSYEIEVSGEIEQLGLVEYVGPEGIGYHTAKPKEGEKVNVICFSTAEQAYTYYTTEIVSISGQGAELSEYAENVLYPAAVVNFDNYCLGIVYQKTSAYMFMDSEEGKIAEILRNHWYVAVLLAASFIGALYGISKKKTKEPVPQPAPQPVPQPTPQPAPQPEPQWSPQPMPQYSGALRLRGVSGCLSGNVYEISSNGLTIGRSAGVTVRFPGDTKGVSREHCRVYWNQGTLMLMDVGSSYGTALEGKGKLQANIPVALKCGDVFYVGSREQAFRVEM